MVDKVELSKEAKKKLGKEACFVTIDNTLGIFKSRLEAAKYFADSALKFATAKHTDLSDKVYNLAKKIIDNKSNIFDIDNNENKRTYFDTKINKINIYSDDYVNKQKSEDKISINIPENVDVSLYDSIALASDYLTSEKQYEASLDDIREENFLNNTKISEIMNMKLPKGGFLDSIINDTNIYEGETVGDYIKTEDIIKPDDTVSTLNDDLNYNGIAEITKDDIDDYKENLKKLENSVLPYGETFVIDGYRVEIGDCNDDSPSESIVNIFKNNPDDNDIIFTDSFENDGTLYNEVKDAIKYDIEGEKDNDKEMSL